MKSPTLLLLPIIHSITLLVGASQEASAQSPAAVSERSPMPSVPDLAALRPHIVLAASFDHGVDADHAAGDGRVFHASTATRLDKQPGLPVEGWVQRLPDGGRSGGMLAFTRKMKPVVFFEGGPNIAHSPSNWHGTVSFWLKLDPEKDLEPGYCDPLQLVGQAWDAGHMFAEFSKDHTPRRFRFAIRPVKQLWNPANVKWEDSTEKPRLMSECLAPPFRRDRWTHVVMTFTGVNVKGKEAEGVLYLDGKEVGRFRREQILDWEAARSALTIGVSYVGGFDELLVLNRALTPNEVVALHQSTDSVAELARK
ncbi:LamG-like jellyroll fold domain-containing protein [Verrucomicrobium spinosum]|uniref:LamG-like jellyroll fold domain-containing protein n=1 Tax=Verrucomicrobium spinosum TaxID=2736 RepID=UPI00017460C9|nr:LamG-like jellyroll fold domain-containing protein [Verrucomicrobium spinosum]